MVLDPIIDGFHMTRVLMDGGSSLNLLYVGFSNRLASQMPKTKKREHKVRTRMKSPGSRTLGGRRSFPLKSKR